MHLTKRKERAKMLDRQTGLLAVIIPVFNGEKYIREAINSVLLQPEWDLIIIAVDDGSTDNTAKILKEISALDDRLIVHRQKNSGVSVARNKGIAISLEMDVQYIAFLDADDVWCKDFYCRAVTELLKKGSFDLIGYDYYVGSEDISRGTKRISDEEAPEIYTHFCSYIYSAKIFNSFHVRFPAGIKINEDSVFLQLFYSFCESYLSVHDNIFIHRSNSNSVMHQKRDKISEFFYTIIPAWEWLIKCLLQNNKSISKFQTIKKALIVEYIKLMCIEGYKLSIIQNDLLGSTIVTTLLEDSSIRMYKECQKKLNNFRKHPYLFWIKYRSMGLLMSCKTILRSFRIVNRLYYKENISSLHY